MNSQDVLLFTQGKLQFRKSTFVLLFRQMSQVITYINLLLPGDPPGPAILQSGGMRFITVVDQNTLAIAF